MAAAIRNVNHPLHEVAMRQVRDGSSLEGQKMIAPFIAQGVNAGGSERLTRGQTRLAALGAALTDPSLLKTEDEYAANMDHPIWTTIKKMVGDIGSVAFAPKTSIAMAFNDPSGKLPSVGDFNLMNQLGRAFKDADASTILRYVEENKRLAAKHAQTLDPSAGTQLARNTIKINAFTTKYNLPIVTEEDFYPKQFQSRRGITSFDVKNSLDAIRNDLRSAIVPVGSSTAIRPEDARAELERRRAAGGK
jgi:hypothetical protein